MKNKRDIDLRAGFSGDVAAVEAHARLREAVFGERRPLCRAPTLPGWWPIGLFDRGGGCVAAAEVATIALVSTLHPIAVGGLRDVAVGEAWRGLGLFRLLMETATRWYDANGLDLVLLYTEAPALYTRFGFAPVAQHAFDGRAPVAAPSGPSRTIDPAADTGLVERLLADRAPVSSQIAPGAGSGLFRDFMQTAECETFSYCSTLDALVVHETDDNTFVLVDVVAPVIPSLAAIIGALGMAPTRVRTLFPPDRLGWHGLPRADDTGLMARGPRLATMEDPFMLPPTAAF